MQKLVVAQLQKLARRTLRAARPIIVGVTGSVGKTTTRQAIAIALEGSFAVRSPEKNYNNELGVPLTILGEVSPGKNVWEWLKLFWRARQAGRAVYPQLLVLEYGADKPGDIRALCNVAIPSVSVITAISPVHVANYANIDALVDEKATLGVMTNDDGVVILNIDDPRVAGMATRMTVPVVTYSVTKEADVRATEIRVDARRDGDTFVTTRAKLRTRHGEADVVLKNCIGTSVVAACAAAAAVAEHFGVPFKIAAERLSQEMQPVQGRLNPIAGARGSLIIDDTYNAAPASVHAALVALSYFTNAQSYKRRIAVLGKMAELGQYSVDEHEAVGRHVAEIADVFVAVGTEMRAAFDAARAAGMSHNAVEWFGTPDAAASYMRRAVETGDVILVKGSQSSRMEKVIASIMAQPEKASELLVRQSEYWKSH